MKKIIVLLSSIFLLMNCGSDSENTLDSATTTEPVVTVPAFVGQWNGSMVAIPPYINDTIQIYVTINNDSTFKLNALYKTSQDTALRDNGYWNVSTDTIYLHGNDCAVYDTTLHVLKQLTTCGDPATIKITIDNASKTWEVPMSSLAPLSAAFNIKLDDTRISSMLPYLVITLYKQ